MDLPVLKKLIPHQDDLTHDIRLGAEMFDFVLCTQVIEAIGLIDGVVVYKLDIVSAVLHDDL